MALPEARVPVPSEVFVEQVLVVQLWKVTVPLGVPEEADTGVGEGDRGPVGGGVGRRGEARGSREPLTAWDTTPEVEPP